MEQTVAAPEVSFSKSFLESLYHLPDGERIRNCIQCGTCAGICPFGPWLDFTPRKIIAALRMQELEDILDSESFWMCVSCYACSASCPQEIPLTDALMTRIKEELLLAGKVPQELNLALSNSHRYGNPLGQAPRNRAQWASKAKPPVPIMSNETRAVDVLWYVGDYPSYHPRVKKMAIALANVLALLEIDFGILGPEEVSDGDSQRLAGERGLFEHLAKQNASAFDKYEFGMIITTDPHAYNSIKNHYPALGFDFPIQHYTQFLGERIGEIKKHLKKSIDARVAYHDPCYIGRANGIFDPPRLLLNSIPGIELVEMSHNRENSLCCGGGGGGMWLDGFQWERTENRLSDWRIREAVLARPIEDFLSTLESENKKLARKKSSSTEAKKKILAVACPYELPRFEDSAKTVDGAQDVLVRDIAELLAESMQI